MVCKVCGDQHDTLDCPKFPREYLALVMCWVEEARNSHDLEGQLDELLGRGRAQFVGWLEKKGPDISKPIISELPTLARHSPQEIQFPSLNPDPLQEGVRLEQYLHLQILTESKQLRPEIRLKDPVGDLGIIAFLEDPHLRFAVSQLQDQTPHSGEVPDFVHDPMINFEEISGGFVFDPERIPPTNPL